jgi:2-haloacid dehalogenase
VGKRPIRPAQRRKAGRASGTAGKVLFVSSNAFGACGANSAGLKVAWIERVPSAALAEELAKNDLIRPLTMFKALRMRMEQFDLDPNYRIQTLSDLLKLLQKDGLEA